MFVLFLLFNDHALQHWTNIRIEICCGFLVLWVFAEKKRKKKSKAATRTIHVSRMVDLSRF